MKAIRLRTEYLENPIGIDARHPRLMWNCEGGMRQTAYRIVTDEWDSGRVESSSMQAVYPKETPDGERVTWKVCLWDENDVCGEWSEAFFEKGISSWQARWIRGDYAASSVNGKKRYPVDCFRKQFQAVEGIASARMYITACGLYEAQLSGCKVGDFYMAPGYTDYRKRIQYQTYDVTEMLHKGENEWTVQLADGWYRGSCGAWGHKNQFGAKTKFVAQLVIRYKDGTTQLVTTDKSWEWSGDGPIRFADNKDGEVVDARCTPTYQKKAIVCSHNVTPSASNNVPVRTHEQFKPKLIVTPSGKKVLDFGQNIQGYITFHLAAAAGDRIFLRFGEMLDENGEFTQKNIQCSNRKITTPLQQVEYICREGENRYRTRFAVFGFQYVLVETNVPFRPEDFTAIAVYSDLEQTGWFESSNELLNTFYRDTVWSARGNHLDIPTDCPTRERQGWAGDAQIFARTASFLFNYAPFARKYENDLEDDRRRDGRYPQIAPAGGVDFYMGVMDGSAGWSDAGVLIPWVIYTQYGDRKILEDHYPAMQRYTEYKLRTLGKWYPTARPTGIKRHFAKDISNYGQSYGEWAEPEDVCAFQVADFVSPHPEETTAYIVYLLQLMTKISGVLGHTEEEVRYAREENRVRRGYQQLVRTEKFSLDTDRQAKLVRPLYMNLLDPEQTAFAEKRLVQALDHYGWRLGTGFLSTPLILYVLADIDIGYAYRLLENEEIPGWLSMPKAGATTIWESWEGPKAGEGVASLNHYSKGAVCEWLFQVCCGIRVEGENHFVIAPKPGGTLTYAGAVYQSVYGRVESRWQRTKDRTVYTIKIPSNCTAEVIIPGMAPQTVGTGEYEFAIV